MRPSFWGEQTNWGGSVSAALPTSPYCEWKIATGTLWILRKGLFQHAKRWRRCTRFERTRSTSPCPPSDPRDRVVRTLEAAFFLHFSHGAVVNQILSFKTTNLFVIGAQQADDVTDAVDAGVDFLFVKIDH